MRPAITNWRYNMEFFRNGISCSGNGFQRRSVRAFASNITIPATGGTIAGGGDSATKSNYTAGKVGVENLRMPFLN